MRISVNMIVLLCMLVVLNAYAGESRKTTQTAIPDSLQVHESDVNSVEYKRAIEHLRNLSNFIRDSKTVPDIVDSARFYIGYPNSLLRIEGYVLYLEAELAKAQYEAAELKMKTGKISNQNLEVLKTKLKKAEQAFENYLASSSFSD